MTAWNGYLVCVGSFSSIETGLVTRSIAKWDGVRWSRFRNDFLGTLDFAFSDQNGLQVGGRPGSFVREDGWPVGTAGPFTTYYAVSEFWGSSGFETYNLHDFLKIGNVLWIAGEGFPAVTARIGQTLIVTNSGPQGVVRALATDGVHIFAGGSFTTFVPSPGAPAQPCTNLVSWNGSAWSEVTLAIDGPVHSLAWFNGSLYIGGNFLGTPVYPRGGLLRLNEQGFLERPKYFDGTVSFLQPVSNQLLVGGLFGSADGEGTAFVAWLACPECRADFNRDEQVEIFDYIDFIELFAQGDVRADFNNDESLDLFDYLDFIESFARGC